MNAKESPSASTSFSIPSLLQHLFFFSISCFPRCCSASALFFFSFCVLPFIFQPKILLFQPKRFCFSPKPFSVQPTPLFQPLFVLFQPFFFLFNASFSSFFFSASFSFSCQLPRPKIFSLDASHFFYLNKSLFSSNLD